MDITVNQNFGNYANLTLEDGNTVIELRMVDKQQRRELAETFLRAACDLTYNDMATEEHHLFVLEHGSNGSDLVVLHAKDHNYFQKRDAQLEFALDMIPNLDDVLEQMEEDSGNYAEEGEDDLLYENIDKG